jgi:hypothetical protein
MIPKRRMRRLAEAAAAAREGGLAPTIPRAGLTLAPLLQRRNRPDYR